MKRTVVVCIAVVLALVTSRTASAQTQQAPQGFSVSFLFGGKPAADTPVVLMTQTGATDLGSTGNDGRVDIAATSLSRGERAHVYVCTGADGRDVIVLVQSGVDPAKDPRCAGRKRLASTVFWGTSATLELGTGASAASGLTNRPRFRVRAFGMQSWRGNTQESIDSTSSNLTSITGAPATVDFDSLASGFGGGADVSLGRLPLSFYVDVDRLGKVVLNGVSTVGPVTVTNRAEEQITSNVAVGLRYEHKIGRFHIGGGAGVDFAHLTEQADFRIERQGQTTPLAEDHKHDTFHVTAPVLEGLFKTDVGKNTTFDLGVREIFLKDDDKNLKAPQTQILFGVTICIM
jgi:hypothetical protein